MPEVFAGIDLATVPQRTGVAVVALERGRLVLRECRLNSRVDPDADLLRVMAGATVTGIDCPLGWPDGFRSFLAEQADGPAGSRPPDDRRSLTYRLTDLQSALPRRPLSVSTDRIALTAFRAVSLLHQLGQSHPVGAVDRSGVAGPVAEVYPRASLAAWGWPADRSAALEQLSAVVELGSHRPALANEHVFDAAICALTALCHRVGATTGPAPGELAAARREGWIAVPTASPESALQSLAAGEVGARG